VVQTSTGGDRRHEQMRFSAQGRTWMIVLRGRWGAAIDRFLVRWTGFSMVTWQYTKAAGRPYSPTLLLTTIGSRSGLLRTSPLPYYPVGDELVVCGTRGGGPTNPMWVGNVRANPQCWLRIRRQLVPARARVATGVERDELFETVAKVHLGLRRYQQQAATHGREVPLVVLTPVTTRPGTAL
jgi:deazaflavin-dependent oxidoreductase (nitroreductase family)